MMKRLSEKKRALTSALVCGLPLCLLLAFSWASPETSGDQVAKQEAAKQASPAEQGGTAAEPNLQATVDGASSAVRRAHAVLSDDASATDQQVQEALDELNRVRQELHEVTIQISSEEAEEPQAAEAGQDQAAAAGEAASEEAAAEQPAEREVPTGEQQTEVEADSPTPAGETEGETAEDGEHESEGEPCDCVLVKPSPNCPKTCVKTDACIYFRLPPIYRPDPVLSAEGVYAFNAILSTAAARGFENAAIRAMNATKACPDCATNNCDKHKPPADDNDDDVESGS